MDKLEKIKEGYSHCYLHDSRGCVGCPYIGSRELMAECKYEMAVDVIVIIKELENRIKKLEEQPKIVRCKDCKHYDRSMIYCNKFGIQDIDDNWFCADGERKDENAGPGKDD